jgi:fucose permease
VPLLPTVAEDVRTPVKKLLASQVFLVALVLMICAGASELTMSQWSSLFVERALEFPKMWGDLLGPSLFAVFMGIGRTIYGIYGNRIEIRGAMLACAVLCVICYAVTVFVPNPFLALLGLTLCGFSVSLMWPGTYSLSAARFPFGGVAMFGMLAVMGDVGAATGPWLAGFASDLAQASTRLTTWAAGIGLTPEQVGLRAGLLVAIVFPLVMVLGLLWLRNEKSV